MKDWKNILKHYKPYHFLFPILGVFMFFFMVITIATKPKPKEESPLYVPSKSPYTYRVAGVGLIEPKNEAIKIGTNIAGVVSAVYVGSNQKVKKGDPLFTIDDRDAKAQLELMKQSLETAKINYEDLKSQLSFYEKVKDKRAISLDDLTKRQFAVKSAASKIKEAEASVKVYETLIDRLTVKAPKDATVLKIDVKPGEFAASTNNAPLMIIGDIDTMHVRVEIDETDALKVNATMPATAYLRGEEEKKPISMTFVYKDPYVLPKRILTGDGNERVDTRVLHAIYQFDNKKIGAYVGQQVDVFIDNQKK